MVTDTRLLRPDDYARISHYRDRLVSGGGTFAVLTDDERADLQTLLMKHQLQEELAEIMQPFQQN